MSMEEYSESSNSNGEGGFTLLEVMVSLAILGFGVILVIQLFSGGLGLARASQDSTEMALLAGDKMTEILSLAKLGEGEESGSERGFSWRVEISPFETEGSIDNPKLHTYKVTISVTKTTDRKGAVTLTSIKTIIE